MSKSDKPIEERRQHRRYPVEKCRVRTLAGVGEVINISMGGVCFRYVDDRRMVTRPGGLGLFLEENDGERLDNLSYKVIWDHAVSNGLSVHRTCGIEFQELTPQQVEQLEQFIWLVTRSEPKGQLSD